MQVSGFSLNLNTLKCYRKCNHEMSKFCTFDRKWIGLSAGTFLSCMRENVHRVDTSSEQLESKSLTTQCGNCIMFTSHLSGVQQCVWNTLVVNTQRHTGETFSKPLMMPKYLSTISFLLTFSSFLCKSTVAHPCCRSGFLSCISLWEKILK